MCRHRWPLWAYSSFTMHQDFGSLCARILAAGRDDIVRFSPGTQRDMQSRLWEAGLSFSNTERVELCTVWACRRQPLWWTHWTTHFIDSGFPPEMLIGFEPRPKKLIGFQIPHRFSMPIRVHKITRPTLTCFSLERALAKILRRTWTLLM